MPHRLDLVRRHIQLVATAVFEQQIVALVATDRTGDHAAEPGDAVLVVDDKAAFSQILENRWVSAAAPGLTVRAARPVTSDSAITASLMSLRTRRVDRGDDHLAGGPTLLPAGPDRMSSTTSCSAIRRRVGWHWPRHRRPPRPGSRRRAGFGSG